MSEMTQTIPDTKLKIQTLEVSVTEAPHNTEFYEWMGKKHFCFFQNAEARKRTLSSSVKDSGVNHLGPPPANLVDVW